MQVAQLLKSLGRDLSETNASYRLSPLLNKNLEESLNLRSQRRCISNRLR